MTQKEKLIQRLRQNPKNVRFEDIDKLLLSFGFEKRQKGSHATRKPFILPVYVKEVLILLDEMDITAEE
jgi:hypothetical protein